MYDAQAAPLVSVIIPVFNDPERLTQCLEALSRQTWPASKLKIIVVDNASDPPVAPRVEKWANVQCIQEPEPGSYIARNAAIALAHGDFIAFTDSDCIPEADWIAQGVGALQENSDSGFVGGRVRVFAEDPDHPRIAEQYELLFAFDQARYIGMGFSVTANLFVRAEVLSKVGPFDTKLRSNGDRDWGERATQEGHLGIFCEKAIVAHPARKTLRDIRKKTTRIAGGRHARGKRRKISKLLIYSVLPRVGRMIRVFQSVSELSLLARLKVTAVRMLVEYSEIWEEVRLRLGGKARR